MYDPDLVYHLLKKCFLSYTNATFKAFNTSVDNSKSFSVMVVTRDIIMYVYVCSLWISMIKETIMEIAVVVLFDVPEWRHEPGDLWTTGSSCSSLDTLHERVV